MDEIALIKIDNLMTEYLDQNRAIKRALDAGIKIPQEWLDQFMVSGNRLYSYSRRSNVHSAVLDFCEQHMRNTWESGQKILHSRSIAAGPKKSKFSLPVWDGDLDSLPMESVHKCPQGYPMEKHSLAGLSNIDAVKVRTAEAKKYHALKK